MKKKKTIKRICSGILTAALLVALCATPASARGFSDVSSNDQYLDAINYVSDNNIMQGTGGSSFSPNATLDRGMLMTVLWRKAGSPYASTSGLPFTDVAAGSYYEEAIAWAYKNGIANGTSATAFSPATKVTREQTAAFLYRYSQKTTTAVNRSTSITGYPDYNNVSSFFRANMEWAIGNGVLKTVNGYLYPKQIMTRKETAYAITAFGTNVERIITQRDNLGFTNTSNNFTESKYYLNTAHFNKVRSLNKSYGGEAQALQFVDQYNSKKWVGSCYGMSAVTVLDKYGQIAYNENYSQSKNMYGVKSSPGYAYESAINFYQWIQQLAKWGKSTTSAIEAINSCISAQGPVIFSFWWNVTNESGGTTEKAHSVIVNSCKKINSTTYQLKIVNPNSLTEQTATLTTGGVYSITGDASSTRTLKTMATMTEFSVFRGAFDIDSTNNYDSARYPQLTSATSENDTLVKPDYQDSIASLRFTLSGRVEVENAEGQRIAWDHGELSGDIPLYDSYVVPNGEDLPAEMVLYVPESDTFTFTMDSGNVDMWVSVTDTHQYSRTKASGLSTVTFSSDGSIDMKGDEIVFETASATVDAEVSESESESLVVLGGRGNNSITLKKVDEKTLITGVEETCNIKLIDTYDNSTISENQLFIEQPDSKYEICFDPTTQEAQLIQSSALESDVES